MNVPRRFPRQVVDRILSIDMEPNNHAIILNFSEEGLGFRALNPVTQLGQLKFSFLDNGERIQATGELVWTDASQKSGGLQLGLMPEWSRDRFRSWVAQKEVVENRVPLPPPVNREIRGAPAVGAEYPAPPQAGAPYSDAPPVRPLWSAHTAQSAPAPAFEPPSFALMGEPEYSRYPEEMGFPDSRGKFLRGFLTGVLIAALVTVVVISVYPSTIIDTLNRGRAAIGLGPAPAATMASSPLPPVAAVPPASASSAAPAAPPPAGSTGAPVAPAPNPNAVNPNADDASSANDGAVPPSTLAPPVPAMPAPPISHATTEASSGGAPAKPALDSGDADLAVARRYLDPKAGAAEHAAAVPALWGAVQKGNIQAEIMLADLYARGDGVTKNCNQARVLLRAAAERGNSEASQKLALVVRYGCR